MHMRSLARCMRLMNVRSCSVSSSELSTVTPAQSATRGKVVQISKAMQTYLRKADSHGKMLAAHQAEFDLGKRYLARMMDADPENFTQEDIDEAISYLLPSGLFSRRARPIMKPPAEIFPAKKAVEFDASGRPYHYMFYTGFPNYYDFMHTIAMKIEGLADRVFPADVDTSTSFLDGAEWIHKVKLEEVLVEGVSDQRYNRFVVLMTKLAEHSKAALEMTFLLSHRTPLSISGGLNLIPEPLTCPYSGRRYVQVEGKRKTSLAKLTVFEHGSGKMDINGRGLDDFPDLDQREQLMAPLAFVDKVGRVDCEGTVEGVGSSSTAGAVRFALSLALAAFENEHIVEQMRQAGLLTRDQRRRERQKPGQRGARAKKTWKKR